MEKDVKSSVGMFDLYKGIIMIALIVYHVFDIYPFDLQMDQANPSILIAVASFFISLFSMALPGMFIISGYGCRKRDPKKFIRQQIQFLAKPYIITAVATCVLLFVSQYTFRWQWKLALKESIKQGLGFAFGTQKALHWAGFTIYPCGPIWFLVTLCFAQMIFQILLNKCSKKVTFGACVVIYLVGSVLERFENKLPFSIPSICTAVLFLYIGYEVKKRKIFQKKFKVWEGIVLFFGLFVIGMPFPNGIRNILIALWMVLLLHGLTVVSAKSKCHLRFARYMGRYSFYILCIHTVEILGFLWFRIVEKTVAWSAGSFVLMAVCRIIGIVIICELIQRRAISRLVCKWKRKTKNEEYV